jgi:aspartyl-tRNA(Asn)/glutamyl-tRNA(Gln) amidotransferase subunit A
MNDDDLAFLSLSDLSGRLAAGELSSVEVTSRQLERIAAKNPLLNAYIAVLNNESLADARAADRRQPSPQLPLLGIPLAIKDIIATAGVPTTAGSRVMANNVPDEDAAVVGMLRKAGAVILGKTNLMEFAYAYPHPDFGETRNPWAPQRTAGGSSGGSAAAVAAGLAYGALGTDTGGSIRSPAAYCGTVGLKPTYGRVSRHGVIPLAWSLDHVGPLTRTVRDAALILDAISEPAPRNPSSVQRRSTSAVKVLDREVAGLRVGVVEELFTQSAEPAVRGVALSAIDQLARLGVALESVTLSLHHLSAPALTLISQAEATSYHWTMLKATPELYGPSVRAHLQVGATVLAKDYLAAQRVRRQITDEVNRVLQQVDALVFPTQATVAPCMGAYEIMDTPADDVLQAEIGHTGLANITGHPAISVPCGFTDEGLPVGLQFTGRAFDEHLICHLAAAYEAVTLWHTMHPML